MLQQLLMTGEGPTDLGGSKSGQHIIHGADLAIGPLATLLLKQLQLLLPEWNSEQLSWHQPEQFCTLISGSELGKRAKISKRVRPSKKIPKGYVEHAQRAAELAFHAQANEQQLAIYFHDTDGTRSQLRDDQELQGKLVSAINFGFNVAEFAGKGVAMIPKPTSEAWLICAKKPEPYQHCAALEQTLSGNDRAADRAPKVQLGKLLNNPDFGRDELLQLVDEIDPTCIDMPSFNQLRTDLCRAVTAITGHTPS
ncbi:hypothetical protein [Oceanisphaera sp. IT1-181]|uniref:hypothetical protein n=1 Tax=Oceanisphaera sp. IT1-181 TaxID=3081199 RepID=UPI0029CAA718|nr:hypothetical protein [Oceanisphaera sp. IT1-181]